MYINNNDEKGKGKKMNNEIPLGCKEFKIIKLTLTC
jgi:hypothetical protein